MNLQDVFAGTQIIRFNPIMKEPLDARTQYFLYLRRLLRLVKWNKGKYTKAQLAFYKDQLCGKQGKQSSSLSAAFDSRFLYLLPFDLASMLAYHPKIVGEEKAKTLINSIVSDFDLHKSTASILRTELEASLGNENAWKKIVNCSELQIFDKYLKFVYQNIVFLQRTPYNLLVTATMSAGKSTLINALVGKKVSLMQNMACTGKIHAIVSKAFEDDITSKYDHDMSIDAANEVLLSDHKDNNTYKITVGTYFNSLLGGERISIFDSPGVNSSENIVHTKISERMIRSGKYKLLLYVLNATQLGTTDDEHHLEVVAKDIGHANIIFVMNKIDHLISDDDDVFDTIACWRRILISKGFKNPIICPLSARAAFLAKKCQVEELSRIERRELDNYIDKFEHQSMQNYYHHHKCLLEPPADDEISMLLNNCGFHYFEKVIQQFNQGGNTDGTDLC